VDKADRFWPDVTRLVVAIRDRGADPGRDRHLHLVDEVALLVSLVAVGWLYAYKLRHPHTKADLRQDGTASVQVCFVYGNGI
jgi:hypothetical protein